MNADVVYRWRLLGALLGVCVAAACFTGILMLAARGLP